METHSFHRIARRHLITPVAVRNADKRKTQRTRTASLKCESGGLTSDQFPPRWKIFTLTNESRTADSFGIFVLRYFNGVLVGEDVNVLFQGNHQTILLRSVRDQLSRSIFPNFISIETSSS